jgi:hypothetical protein
MIFLLFVSENKRRILISLSLLTNVHTAARSTFMALIVLGIELRIAGSMERIYLRRGERMKISILLKIIFFTILWHIILVFIEICNFVIPGKCSNCWMKWKFFRKTIIQENDEPRPICRSCIKKFKDTNLWDDLHGPQKYDPQYSNEVENESSKLI